MNTWRKKIDKAKPWVEKRESITKAWYLRFDLPISRNSQWPRSDTMRILCITYMGLAIDNTTNFEDFMTVVARAHPS